MYARLHLGVGVADLVRVSRLSRAHAYRVFTEAYGVPPRQAVSSARLWLAGSLLAAGLGVAEVARQAGYPSAATFSRAWRREHGAAPRAMRRR
jgi:AraC-like DNA-binding protein